MSSDIYFNVASWFPGNVRVKPHFNTQCPPPASDIPDYMLIISNETSLVLNRVVNRHKYVWESRKLSWTNSWNYFNTDHTFNDIHLFVHYRLFFVRSTPINPKYDDWFCQIYKDLRKLFWNLKLVKLVFWISEQFV